MNKILTFISAIVLINSLIPDEGAKLLEGKFQIRSGFNVTVTSEEDGLYIEADRQPKEKLSRISDALFKIESIDGTIDYSLIQKNQRDRVIIKMYGQTIHAPRLPLEESDEEWEEIDVSHKVLKYYEGIYELAEGTLIFVNADDDELMVQLTAQPEIEVYPFAENKFFYKVVEASIEFVKNGKNDVEYLLLYQNGIILQADRM